MGSHKLIMINPMKWMFGDVLCFLLGINYLLLWPLSVLGAIATQDLFVES